MEKNTFKSIGAVLAGFITVFVLSLGTDFALQKLGVFPGFEEPSLFTWRMLFFALIYRSIYTVAGGYVTARSAPNRPMRHAVILGIIGIVAGTLGSIAMWDKGSHWYPISLIVLALPCTWLGGKLRIRNQ
jgi:hypothetical protein